MNYRSAACLTMSAPDRLGPVLSGVIRRDGALDLQSFGDSMFPLIRSGDLCRFVGCDPDRIRVGDVVLVCAESGKLVAHRVHRVLHASGTTAVGSSAAVAGTGPAADTVAVRTGEAAASRRLLLLCKGDANAGFDRVIEAEQCVGKLLWIRRGGGAATLRADHRAVVWWGRMVCAIPFISRLLRRWLDWSRKGGAMPLD